MALYDPEVAALVARLQALPDRLRSVAFWPSDDGASVAADDQVHAIPTVYACIGCSPPWPTNGSSAWRSRILLSATWPTACGPNSPE